MQMCLIFGALLAMHVAAFSLPSPVNVKKYGALGDGRNDDTIAVRNAIRRADAERVAVYFPPGTYRISSTISLPSRTCLYGYAATILAAPSKEWRKGRITALFNNEAHARRITIAGLIWHLPRGNAAYGRGGYAHAIEFIGAKDITIHNNFSGGGGDFVALQGTSNSLIIANYVTNVSNSCFDHWAGSARAYVLGNYCSTLASGGKGVAGIQFTGINTNNTPANNHTFRAAMNLIDVQTDDAQGIMVNGHPAAGADDNGKILFNYIRLLQNAWGVLVTGKANRGIIMGNIIFDMSKGQNEYHAVGVYAPASSWGIHLNVVISWRSIRAAPFCIKAIGTSSSFNNSYASLGALYC